MNTREPDDPTLLIDERPGWVPASLARREKKERHRQARAVGRLLRILGLMSLALPAEMRRRLVQMDLAASVTVADDVEFGEILGEVRRALKEGDE